MPHTGAKVTVRLNGSDVLAGDSDWLHMKAIEAAIDQGIEADPMGYDHPPILFFGHQCPGGQLELWVQPITIPDPPPDA